MSRVADPSLRLSTRTPVRRAEHEVIDGCRVLSSPDVTYLDGSEQRLWEVISRARDLTSLSDELGTQARTWAERYHLSLARPNLLRALELPTEAAVLEVGAGCGALTRFLGESCAAIDALEPVAERARIARARTRDQTNVEVFVGRVEDLPPEPAYDLVLVVGVLEYVASGAPAKDLYVDFLRRVAAVLRERGTLVLAIENRLGVKYLAGAREDHSGRVFDSVEDYPYGTPGRCFSRSELTQMLADAGLRSTFLHAFPDYKLTRVLLTDELLQKVPELAWRIPNFPSEDWSGRRAHTVSEAALWRSLVQGGLGAQFANSFVVLAGNEEGRGMWPSGRLAAFLPLWRRPRYMTKTGFGSEDGRMVFRRQRLVEAQTDRPGGLIFNPGEESEYLRGRELLEVLASADATEQERWLGEWVAMFDGAVRAGGPMPIDLVPHNVLISESAALQQIDQEWWHSAYSREDVLGRAALLTGSRLAHMTAPSRWAGESVRDVVLQIGAWLGLPRDGEWLPAAVQHEAGLQAAVSTGWAGIPGDGRVDEIQDNLLRDLASKLNDLPLGKRDHERVEEAQAQLRQTNNELLEARKTIRTMRGSTSWRVTAPLRRLTKALRRN